VLLNTDSVAVFSQPAAPAFEVPSVKAIQDTKTWAIRRVDAQLYRSVSNVMQTLTWSWRVKNYHIPDAPAWLGQERFEISATIGHPVGDDEVRLRCKNCWPNASG